MVEMLDCLVTYISKDTDAEGMPPLPLLPRCCQPGSALPPICLLITVVASSAIDVSSEASSVLGRRQACRGRDYLIGSS